MNANSSANTSPTSNGAAAWRQLVFHRRRRTLYAFMLLTCTGMLLVYLLILLADVGTDAPIDNLSNLQNAAIATLLGTAVCYLVARAGRVELAAVLFLGLTLLVASFVDQPREVIGGRSSISFPILIVIAGLLLTPSTAFVVAGLSTLAVVALAVLLIPDPDFVQVISDAIIFFVVAAITWWYASRLERAYQNLFKSQAALETLNAGLEQRIAERTAELRQANAQLAQSSRLKDEFLATMSHELRTPLSSVLVVAEALEIGLYGPLTSRQREKMGEIASGGQRLLKLVKQMLDYAQIEAGKLRLTLRPVYCLSLCREVVQEMAAGAVAKGQLLQLRSEVDDDTCVLADPQCLREILATLLDNALKFTPAGGSIGLDVLPGSEPGSLHFVVWDTGIGMAVADLALIFQPFRQLDAGLNRGYEGAGLSLALAWRLAALQGGSLHAASTLGEGSRFTLALGERVAGAPE